MTMQVVAPPSGGFEGSPDSGSRIVDWLRRNLFSSISNTLLTLLVVAAFALIVPPASPATDATLLSLPLHHRYSWREVA